MSQAQPTKEEKERFSELVTLLEHHGWRYHVLDDPELSDAEYDALFRELVVLEEKYPELQSSHSPTARVGGRVLSSLPTMRHASRMYSLDNAFGLSEWNEFTQRLLRVLPTYTSRDLAFWMEPKMDGLAMELIYEQGILTMALTRGDGETGEVVTENMRTVRSIPLRLKGENIPLRVEVRGEVVMTKKDFLALNQTQEKKGQKTFANARNAAAGSVRQLDSSVAASRPLSFVAYGIGEVEWGGENPWKTQQVIIQGLASLGFLTAPEATRCPSAEEAGAWFERLASIRDTFPFELDGGVAKLDDLALQEKAGFTSRAPRWAIAWKFAAMQAQTRLEDIIISVGRTGVLTPVAILAPVNVGGVTVSRATLHNEDEVRNKELLIGDTVIIQRAGDVIPEVVQPVKEKRTGAEREFVFPSTCPECQSHVHREQGESAWRCINRLCPAIRRESIKHFVSKAGLDIKGVGAKWIEQFVELEMVKSPADLFRLTKERLLGLDRMGETLAEKFIDAFTEIRSTATLPRFICALGIRHVGEQTAKALARKFGSIEEIANATEGELQKISDIGPEVALAICEFFEEEGNKRLLAELKELGLSPTMGKSLPRSSNTQTEQRGLSQQLQLFTAQDESTSDNVSTDLPLAGKSFLFTGTLSMARSKAQAMAEDAGADIIGSVSKKLDYLVAGEKAGSKLTKAQALGVTILTEEAFLEMLNVK